MGGDLIAGHLADGELAPVSAASPAVGGWQLGPADPQGPLSAAGVQAWVEIRVDLAFMPQFSKRVFKK